MKSKVTTEDRHKTISNGGSLYILVPSEMKRVAKLKPNQQVVHIQYQGPMIKLEQFTIRDGDLIIRKKDPISV
jgi:hypothetical protein